MQQWEYLDVQNTWNKKGVMCVKQLDGQELKDWEKLELRQYLNGLGEQGWEMVSAPGISIIFFKRPKP